MTDVHTTAARRRLPPVVQRFLDTEAAGGVVLVVAAIVALLWANSPWRDSYETLWHTHVSLKIGAFGVENDLKHLVNDGLMAVFFFVVGLEIKRELVVGDLRDPRVAALPAMAALGGMVVPAAIYALFNAGGPGGDGWGIPMATDIAFAVGVVTLLGTRVPASLKLLLLSLAIVDDIGAILVIAIFYAGDIGMRALLFAGLFAFASWTLRRARVQWGVVHALLGLACWLATYESGVHATIAGVLFGLLTPARPFAPGAVAARWSLDLSDELSAGEIHSLTAIANESVSPAERLQHQLHPVTSFLIVPVFALANAGVELHADSLAANGATAVALGVGLGLVVGKIVGIVGATWLAVRSGLAPLPEEVTWGAVAGIAALAGIGFTVSLFVAGLAFDDPALEAAAKVAVLVASVVASIVGSLLLLRAGRAALAADSPH